MKKKLILFAIVTVLLLPYNTNYNYEIRTNQINYKESTDVLEQLPGTYTSIDEKTITIATDGTTKYLDTYTLTVQQAATGNILSGKVGTNNKVATFYQLNDTTLVSSTAINYTTAEGTVYLYDHTIFKTAKSILADQSGVFELWRNNSKVNSYKTLQDAVDAATAGDTIKITKDIKVNSGTYINKNINIDGQNHILDKSNWANPVFVVEEGITTNIKNLTIDGGANNFEVDFSLEIPKIKDGTLEKDSLSNISAVISKGNITLDKVNLNNHYTNSIGSALKIVRGNANISNSTFNHNKANTEGGAIYIGSKPRQDEKEFTVKNVEIKNSTLNYNYVTLSGSVAGGAAISVNYTENISVDNCNFIYNYVAGWASGGGPAIFTNRNTLTYATANDLDFTKLSIKNSLFEKNYVTNDGAAIENECAEMEIIGSKFIGNVGLKGGQSVGTISNSIDSKKYADVVIKDSIFDSNIVKSGVSVIGDHGGLVNIYMDNVQLKNNVGTKSFLIYSASLDLKNVTFENEIVTTSVIDVRTLADSNTYPEYEYQNINFADVTFKNTNGPTDVLIRKNNHVMSYNKSTVNINGPTSGEIHIWDNNSLNINANYTGKIYLDGTILPEDVKVKNTAKIIGKIIENPNTYTFITHHPVSETNTDVISFLYLEKGKTYTEKEMFMLLKNNVEGYTTKWYTNTNYTSEWDFTPTAHATIYGKLEEHTHEFDGKLVVDDNKIYEQCTLGHFGKELSLSVTKNNSYTGKEIPISVTNTINAKDYKIVYYVKENNNWKKLNTIPKDAGTYKAVLTYNDMSIEQEYNIEPNNPNTAVNIGVLSFILILLFASIICFNNFKNLKIKKYNN